MDCTCTEIYRKERLDESFREVFRKYQKHVVEDSPWFSIELEFHLKHTYTKFETKQLTNVFGSFPNQIITVFGEWDRIILASNEIIKHFGGLLQVCSTADIQEINEQPGVKIPIQKKNDKYPLQHDVDYWLVNHVFIRSYFEGFEDRYDRFKLAQFLTVA